MDGNRRWAREKKYSLDQAYNYGVRNLHKTVENAIKLKLKYLTVFGFSTENWNRSKPEIKFLFKLFESYLDEALSSLNTDNVKIRFIGNFENFDQKIQIKMKKLTDKTIKNSKITLTLAVNYGGRYDVIQATKRMFSDKNYLNLNEKNFSSYLLNYEIPSPDLLIRTGGELRLSNFLLWDLAYTELLFLPVMWPDFDLNLLNYSVSEYKKRKRNFGGNDF